MLVRVVQPFTATDNGFHRLFLPPSVVELENVEAFVEQGLVSTDLDAVSVSQAKPAKPADPAGATETAKEPASKAGKTKRPLKTAHIDRWREYAEGLGLDVKGLSREEIIAAVKVAE